MVDEVEILAHFELADVEETSCNVALGDCADEPVDEVLAREQVTQVDLIVVGFHRLVGRRRLGPDVRLGGGSDGIKHCTSSCGVDRAARAAAKGESEGGGREGRTRWRAMAYVAPH